jgi:hypothetical protein
MGVYDQVSSDLFRWLQKIVVNFQHAVIHLVGVRLKLSSARTEPINGILSEVYTWRGKESCGASPTQQEVDWVEAT